MSASSGAAKVMRRGFPAREASGLANGDNQRLPRRSSLKKSSSFSLGDKKQHLRSGLQDDGKSGDASHREHSGPGVTRRASMGSTRTSTIEVRMRGQRFPVRRRRSINFDQRVEVKEVVPVTELIGHCSEIWLQDEDFAKIKQDRKTLVQNMKEQHQRRQQNEQRLTPGKERTLSDAKTSSQWSSEEMSSLRGLEKYIDKSIRDVKHMGWETVMLEQDEQEMAGEYNDERLADLYKHFTRESPDKALARARQDEQEIQDYLWSPRTTKLMLRRLPQRDPNMGTAAANDAAATAVG